MVLVGLAMVDATLEGGICDDELAGAGEGIALKSTRESMSGSKHWFGKGV